MHLELFIDLGFPGQRSQNAGDVASSAGKQKYSSLRIQMCCKSEMSLTQLINKLVYSFWARGYYAYII